MLHDVASVTSHMDLHIPIYGCYLLRVAYLLEIVCSFWWPLEVLRKITIKLLTFTIMYKKVYGIVAPE